MKRILIILAIFWLFFPTIFAQPQARIDSILNVLKNEKSEKAQIKIYNQLAGFYDGFELSGSYSFKALKLAEINKDIDGQIDALTQLSYFYYGNYIMDYDSAKICINKAIDLCKKYNKDLKLANIYFRYARIIHFSNQSAYIITYYKNAIEIFSKYKQNRNVAFVWFLSGLYYYSINYPDSAFYYYSKEHDLGKKLNDPFIQLFSLNHLATNYKTNDRTICEKYFKQAERIIQTVTPHDTDIALWYREVAWLYRNYANIIFNYDKDLSLKYLQIALENVHKADKIDPYNYDVCLIKSTGYLKMFEIYLSQKKYENAKNIMHTALSEYTNPVNKAELAYIYESFSYLYSNYGKFSDAIDCIENALRLRTEINDKAYYVNALYYLAEIYRKTKDYEKQKETILKLQSMEIPKKFSYIHFFIQAYLARIYVHFNNPDSANFYHQHASEINQKLQIPFYSLALKTIKANMIEANEPDSAIRIYLSVLKEKEHIGEHDYSKLPTENSLAKLYFAKKQYDKAIFYALLGLEKTENYYFEFQAENCYILYESYKNQGKCDLALQYHEKYSQAKEIAEADDAKRELQKKDFEKQEKARMLEIQKLEHENKLREAKIDKQNTLNYSFAGGSSLLILVIFITYRSYKHKKEVNIALSQQKEEILAQSEEIASQRDMLYQQKKDITDSIEYAKYIQEALLSSKDILSHCELQNFILFMPRNIISGDFYWFKQVKNYIYFAAADCTGHGVPGAFMSVLGISLLNEIVGKRDLNSPDIILNDLRKKLKKSLQQDNVEVTSRDGMDISLCLMDMETRKIQFAGAYNPLVIIRNNEVLEIEADKMPVGIHPKDNNLFTNHEVQLQEQDMLYIFSDGYESQFGGVEGKKFTMKRFKELLQRIHKQSLDFQKNHLEQALIEWRGNIDQVDDVMVVGVRI